MKTISVRIPGRQGIKFSPQRAQRTQRILNQKKQTKHLFPHRRER
jgi:hypothetical protein